MQKHFEGRGSQGNCRCNASLVTDDLFVCADRARIGRSRDLREYFSPAFSLQLAFPPFSYLISGSLRRSAYAVAAAAGGFNTFVLLATAVALRRC